MVRKDSKNFLFTASNLINAANLPEICGELGRCPSQKENVWPKDIQNVCKCNPSFYLKINVHELKLGKLANDLKFVYLPTKITP